MLMANKNHSANESCSVGLPQLANVIPSAKESIGPLLEQDRSKSERTIWQLIRAQRRH